MKKMTSSSVARGLALWLLALVCCAGCALKGSKAEYKYEGRSNCSKPGFTCGNKMPGLDTGLKSEASPDSAQTQPSLSNERGAYAPLCRLKNGNCDCECEPAQ